MKKYFLFLTLVVSSALYAANQQQNNGQDQGAQQMPFVGLNAAEIRQQMLRDFREEQVRNLQEQQDCLLNIINIKIAFSAMRVGQDNAQEIANCRREIADIQIAINRLNVLNNLPVVPNNIPAVENDIPDDGLGL